MYLSGAVHEQVLAADESQCFRGLRSGTQVFGRVGLAGEVCRLERWVLAQIFTDAHDGWKLVKVHFESIEKKSF